MHKSGRGSFPRRRPGTDASRLRYVLNLLVAPLALAAALLSVRESLLRYYPKLSEPEDGAFKLKEEPLELEFPPAHEIAKFLKSRDPREAQELSWYANGNVVVVTDPSSGKLSLWYGPDRSRKYVPLTSVARVDDIIADLDWGNIAFNVPPTMFLNRQHLAELLLSPSHAIADLEAQLHDKTGMGTDRIRISNRMEARLVETSDFKVKSLAHDVQAITSAEVTSWKWEVTPTETGKRTLALALYAQLVIDGQNTPLKIKTFDRVIQVSVTTPQRLGTFAQTNWQWLMTAIAIPLVLLGWKQWGKRKKRRESRNRLESTPLSSPWIQ